MDKEVEKQKLAVTIHLNVLDSPYIKSIHNLSDDFSDIEQKLKEFGIGVGENSPVKSLSMARARIGFHNRMQMSVIQGGLSHGGSDGLFEIMIIGVDGMSTGAYFEQAETGLDVLGRLTVEQVKHYIDKIGRLVFETDVILIDKNLVGSD